MNVHPIALALLFSFGVGCSGGLRPAPKMTKTAGAFDLASGPTDDNGFVLNPSWNTEEKIPDPRGCSWRFVDGGERPDDTRLPCNTQLVDPDFSNSALTALGVTCLDSDLNMRGHINWGESWGGAVTFEGSIGWDSYSGGSPNDGDYNFVLTPPDGATLTPGSRGTIKLEFDSGEINRFASKWWVDFERTVFDDPDAVARFVGNDIGIVSGLLGIDAEHEDHLEIHPVYAMALRVPNRTEVATCKNGSGKLSTWAFFVRDQGNQGGCSRVGRVHSIALPNRHYIFRLPLPRATCIEIGSDSRFFASAVGKGTVFIQYDEHLPDSGVVVIVGIEPGETVDGELHILTDVAAAAEAMTPDAGARAAIERPPVQASSEWKEFKKQIYKMKKDAPDEHRALVQSAGGKPLAPITPTIQTSIPDKLRTRPAPSLPTEIRARPKSSTLPATKPADSPEARFCKTPRKSGVAQSMCKEPPKASR